MKVDVIYTNQMRLRIYSFFILTASMLISSCNSTGTYLSVNDEAESEKVIQQDDGTFALNLEQACFYNNDSDPSCNTAEWSIIVSKPGRYKVWLSSATTDTMNLQYKSSVKISLEDERIEAKPVGDKIVLNTSDVKYPYFRADSFMGTFYIQEPGEYNIQVISEKVIPQAEKAEPKESPDNTKLMSVILTPMTR